MDEEEEVEYEVWERPLQRADFAVLGLNLFRGVVDALSETLLAAQGLVAAHANFKNSQRIFHEEAALEIETITGEQDG